MGALTIDIGGTFTDVVFFEQKTGDIRMAKSLTPPLSHSDSILSAIRAVGVGPEDVDHLTLGSTIAINTVLQRSGARTALITTRGFRDVLEIGRGNRPDLYNFRYRKPEPFVPRALRFEVSERIEASGAIQTPLDEHELRQVARACRDKGVEAIAVQFLHSYREPRHEERAAAILSEELPGVMVTASHEVCREWGEYERASTAVFNAYLQPVVQRYFGAIESSLRDAGFRCPLYAMQSNGGIAVFSQAIRHPVTLIESGPSGGINAATHVAELCGESKVLYLDIGGTTAKCAIIVNYQPRITGEFWVEKSRESAGYPVRIPVVDIVEIGTGGGSIGWIGDSGTLNVGPISAGADPAPACYGRGGIEPTVTDANLIAGLIRSDYFAEGRISLSPELAIASMERLGAKLALDAAQVSSSIRRVADAAMADALRLVSIQRGHDPNDFSMVVGGGAGPLHAARLAQELGVREVIIPRHPGYTSAIGIMLTSPRRDFVKTQPVRSGDVDDIFLRKLFEALEAEAHAYFENSLEISGGKLDCEYMIDARYAGQNGSLTLYTDKWEMSSARLAERFADEHENAFSFRLEQHPIEFVTYRLRATLDADIGFRISPPNPGKTVEQAHSHDRTVDFIEYGKHKTRVFVRDLLPHNHELAGPALIEEPSSTTVVLPGQRFFIDEAGLIHIFTAQDEATA